jgi:hypothetical protein
VNPSAVRGHVFVVSFGEGLVKLGIGEIGRANKRF